MVTFKVIIWICGVVLWCCFCDRRLLATYMFLILSCPQNRNLVLSSLPSVFSSGFISLFFLSSTQTFVCFSLTSYISLPVFCCYVVKVQVSECKRILWVKVHQSWTPREAKLQFASPQEANVVVFCLPALTDWKSMGDKCSPRKRVCVCVTVPLDMRWR